jgi:hypothetical protein
MIYRDKSMFKYRPKVTLLKNKPDPGEGRG